MFGFDVLPGVPPCDLVRYFSRSIPLQPILLFHVEHCVMIGPDVPRGTLHHDRPIVPRGTSSCIRSTVPQEGFCGSRICVLQKMPNARSGVLSEAAPRMRCSTWNIFVRRNNFHQTLVLEFVLLSVIMNYTKTALWLNKGAVS